MKVSFEVAVFFIPSGVEIKDKIDPVTSESIGNEVAVVHYYHHDLVKVVKVVILHGFTKVHVQRKQKQAGFEVIAPVSYTDQQGRTISYCFSA